VAWQSNPHRWGSRCVFHMMNPSRHFSDFTKGWQFFNTSSERIMNDHWIAENLGAFSINWISQVILLLASRLQLSLILEMCIAFSKQISSRENSNLDPVRFCHHLTTKLDLILWNSRSQTFDEVIGKSYVNDDGIQQIIVSPWNP
jgi:hypothetical protein